MMKCSVVKHVESISYDACLMTIATGKNFTSGYAKTLNESKSALYWVLYPPNNSSLDPTKTPVVIWLQGGNEMVISSNA
jgi:carboxypeptidase C (cathepsin A)